MDSQKFQVTWTMWSFEYVFNIIRPKFWYSESSNHIIYNELNKSCIESARWKLFPNEISGSIIFKFKYATDLRWSELRISMVTLFRISSATMATDWNMNMYEHRARV